MQVVSMAVNALADLAAYLHLPPLFSVTLCTSSPSVISSVGWLLLVIVEDALDVLPRDRNRLGVGREEIKFDEIHAMILLFHIDSEVIVVPM